MNKAHLLMCCPIFYEVVHYKLNNHMKMKRPVNIKKVISQWEK